jgi:hypothetical protein
VPPELPPQEPDGSGSALPPQVEPPPPPTTPKKKKRRSPDKLGAVQAGRTVAIIGPFDRAKK